MQSFPSPLLSRSRRSPGVGASVMVSHRHTGSLGLWRSAMMHEVDEGGRQGGIG